MDTIGFAMDPSKIKEFLIHQCKIAQSLGAVNVKITNHEFIFFDKNNDEVLRINY